MERRSKISRIGKSQQVALATSKRFATFEEKHGNLTNLLQQTINKLRDVRNLSKEFDKNMKRGKLDISQKCEFSTKI